MRSIGNLFTAFANLAASVKALAGVIDVATGRLRQQLALDDAVPALRHSDVLDAEEPPHLNATLALARRRPDPQIGVDLDVGVSLFDADFLRLRLSVTFDQAEARQEKNEQRKKKRTRYLR
jgi:hypothetical protein